MLKILALALSFRRVYNDYNNHYKSIIYDEFQSYVNNLLNFKLSEIHQLTIILRYLKSFVHRSALLIFNVATLADLNCAAQNLWRTLV